MEMGKGKGPGPPPLRPPPARRPARPPRCGGEAADPGLLPRPSPHRCWGAGACAAGRRAEKRPALRAPRRTGRRGGGAASWLEAGAGIPPPRCSPPPPAALPTVRPAASVRGGGGEAAAGGSAAVLGLLRFPVRRAGGGEGRGEEGGGELPPAERLAAGSGRLRLFLGLEALPVAYGLSELLLRRSGSSGWRPGACATAEEAGGEKGRGRGLRGRQPAGWGHTGGSAPQHSGRGRRMGVFQTSPAFAKPLPWMQHRSVA